LSHGTVALRRRGGIALRSQLLQGYEIRLGGRKISRPQVLSKLLEFFLKLLHFCLIVWLLESNKFLETPDTDIASPSNEVIRR
jgi:hypothetical protein